MERLYCTINEEQARIAHDMMSMSDYKVGSKTEEYRGYVDKAYWKAFTICPETYGKW